MKVAIIHLSDIHFSVNKQSEIQSRLRKLQKAINCIEDIKYCILAITGDISSSGKQAEYSLFKISLNNFVSDLEGMGNKVFCVCVPGNHDVNHTDEKKPLELQKVYRDNDYQKEISSQLKLLRNYNKFAEEYGCEFKDCQLVKSIIVNIEDLKLELLLINNAVFSQKDQNYKGLLFLSDTDIDYINENKEADFAICLMHHNTDYFSDAVKHKAKNLILRKSSIMLLGHEHDEEVLETISDNSHTEIRMCSAFFDDEQNSSASVYVVDTKKQTIKDYNFTWDKSGQGFFNKDEKKAKTIKLKRFEDSFLSYNKDYIERVRENHKYKELGGIDDYYVFPRLIEENHSGDEKYSNEIKSLEDFYSVLQKNKRIEIVGNSSNGKTSLLQFLLLDREKRAFGKYPLLLTADDFSFSTPETIIQNKLKNTFDNDSKTSLMYYLQMNEDDKILLIDDYDLIDETILEQFLVKYGSCFKYHVYSVHNSILDFSQVLKERIINEEMKFYRITPFLSDKREDLVSKVVSIRYPGKESLIESITNAFSTKRSILSATPSFIIMFCNFYCGNYGVSTIDSNIYSKVFESSIIETLKKDETSKLNTDKMMIVLQKIAFFVHSNNRNYLTEEEIISIIEQYEKDYLTSIDTSVFIGIINSAQIIVQDGMGFRFCDENVLAYFVAKEICSYDDVSIKNSLIVEVMKNACYSINTSVLLFIIHIQQDTVLLTTLIDESSKYIDSWQEFSFEDSKKQVNSPTSNNEFVLSYDESKHDEVLNREKEERLNKEREIEESENKNRNRDFYDFKDSNTDSAMNKLLRVCNLMYILSKCLPIFEHRILGPVKNKLTDLIYSLPNKIFNVWTTMFEASKAAIIESLRKTWIEYRSDSIAFPEDQFEYLLWWESLSLLISLYDNSCGVATSEATKEFLINYNRQTNNGITLTIQKLLISTQRASSPKFFLDNAKELIEIKDEPANTVIRRIVLHGIIHITNVDKKKLQSLATSYFGKKDSQIMKERLKLESKKKNVSE